MWRCCAALRILDGIKSFHTGKNLRRHASRASATNGRSHRERWKVRWILLSWENWVCFMRTDSFPSLGGNKRLLRCHCKQSVIKMKCEVRDTWCECDTCVPVRGWLLRHVFPPVSRCVQASSAVGGEKEKFWQYVAKASINVLFGWRSFPDVTTLPKYYINLILTSQWYHVLRLENNTVLTV